MRLTPGVPKTDWRADLEEEMALRGIELDWIESERARITPVADRAPRDAARFLKWFSDLQHDGPGQHDPLFGWLAEAATLCQMRWFLRQELASAIALDDLVALAQIGLPHRPKLGAARDFWHRLATPRGPLLTRLADELGLPQLPDDIMFEARAIGNLMCGLAANRCYAFQAIGAIGVAELATPGRAAQISAGLERLGISRETRRYYETDGERSASWNRDVLGPLVAGNVDLVPLIAEGALLWLEITSRSFSRYRQELAFVHANAA
jgi:hypothetical protein